MRILVVASDPDNIWFARQTLREHDLTIVSSYDEAIGLLPVETGQDPLFDVVLTDLLLPFSDLADKWIQKNNPPHGVVNGGLVIALRAAHLGVKHVAVATDCSHRYSFMGDASEDLFYHPAKVKQLMKFMIPGSNAHFLHDLGRIVRGESGWNVRVKDWGSVLQFLLTLA